jgi:hypothetical protein
MTLEILFDEIRSLNVNILKIKEKLGKYKNKDSYNYTSSCKINFNSGVLKIQLNTIEFEKINLDFSGVNNFFNHSLPQNDYFDLTHIIDKYKFLKDEKCNELIIPWRDALKNIYLFYEKLETTLTNKTHFIEDLLKKFNKTKDEINENNIELILYSKNNNLSLNFDYSLENDFSIQNNKNFDYLCSLIIDNYFSCNKLTLSITDNSQSIQKWPTEPNKDSYGPRGYIFSLIKSIYLKKIEIPFIIKGELSMFILDTSKKIIYKNSVTGTSLDKSIYSFYLKNIVLHDGYSIFFHFSGQGCFLYKYGNNDVRKIIENLSLISKYINGTIKENVENSILDNCYSIELDIFYSENEDNSI